MEQEMTFIMHTPQGDVTMRVLFTFFSDITNAHYMLYTPDALDGGTVQLNACRYDPEDLTKILPLQGDLDRNVVQSFVNYLSTHTPEEIAQAAPGI